VVEAAELVEGEVYPTASSVIPSLEQIFTDLGNRTTRYHGYRDHHNNAGELSTRLRGVCKRFVDQSLYNLKMARPKKRFPTTS
jgi:hypothetical protein